MNSKTKTQNDSWLIIQPYTYIFVGNNKAMLYNTLSHNSFIVKDPECISLIKNILDTNTNSVIIHDDVINRSQIQKFIKVLHDNKLGTLYSARYSNIKPISLNNKIYFEKNYKKTSIDNILSYNIQEVMQELNQIYLYITGKCNEQCDVCNSAYKQSSNCYCSTHQTSMDIEFMEIKRIISLLDNINCEINILGGNIFLHKEFNLIFNFIQNLSKKCVLHINAKHIVDENRINNILNFCNPKLTINFLCNDTYDYKKLTMIKLDSINHTFSILVKSEKDINFIEKEIGCSEIILIPFFNDKNYNFFFNNVLLDIDDISKDSIDMLEIHRRENINESNYGRLFITPNSDVFSNLTNDMLGNIRESSIGELIIKEMRKNDGWFHIRKNIEECGNCIYHNFCPSPTNYEKIIGLKRICKERP